jgi:glycosyltransferase involved in cell wall biosynthesis
MRILHISTRLILGGSQENTVLSCMGQAQRGHDVHLAFGPIYGPEGSLLELVATFRALDGRRIQTHIVPHMIREISAPADLRAYRELRRLLAAVQPDIVHTHSSKAGILGRAAAWAENQQRQARGQLGFAPMGVVHTIHGPPFMPVEGSPLAQARTRINNFLYTLAERYAARRCDAIVSVADAMTRQFLARRIGRPEQYSTIYSGMQVDQYLNPGPGQSREEMRARLGLGADDIVIGTVARLAQHKGHDDLLAALAADLRQRPELKLLWVGDGWWRQRLIDRARGMGLVVRELDRESGRRGEMERSDEEMEKSRDEGIGRGQDSRANASLQSDPLTISASHAPDPRGQVLLTGLVPPQAIAGHIRAMDILAHTSYREGLPRTVPQALLCGVVPIAYDVDGTGEVCRDMETGRLVPPGDFGALRGAMLWLADNAEQRQHLAAAGREWCRLRFSADTMVDQLLHLYERTLTSRGRSSPPPT